MESKLSLAVVLVEIAGADRVELSLPGPKIKVTLGKEQVQAVVNSVSSAFRDSGHYRAKFSYAASFFAGTNRAGTIYFCGNLILIEGKQYRDSTDQFRLLAQKPLENGILRPPRSNNRRNEIIL